MNGTSRVRSLGVTARQTTEEVGDAGPPGCCSSSGGWVLGAEEEWEEPKAVRVSYERGDGGNMIRACGPWNVGWGGGRRSKGRTRRLFREFTKPTPNECTDKLACPSARPSLSDSTPSPAWQSQ